jgi:hypothetical protein
MEELMESGNAWKNQIFWMAGAERIRAGTSDTSK